MLIFSVRLVILFLMHILSFCPFVCVFLLLCFPFLFLSLFPILLSSNNTVIQFSLRLYRKQYPQFAPFSFTCNHSERATCLRLLFIQLRTNWHWATRLFFFISKLADHKHKHAAFPRNECRILSTECWVTYNDRCFLVELDKYKNSHNFCICYLSWTALVVTVSSDLKSLTSNFLVNIFSIWLRFCCFEVFSDIEKWNLFSCVHVVSSFFLISPFTSLVSV